MNGPNDRDLLPVASDKVEPIRERPSRAMDKLRKILISRNSIYGLLLLSGIIVVLLLLTKPFQEQGLDYLTEAERTWLGENSEKIEVLFGGEAPPEDYHDENGKYVGFLVDFLHEIERHLSVSFRVRKFSTWEELMAYSRSQRDFIIVGIAQTEERMRYLSFTNPFVKIPYVIITKRANTNVALTDLEQATVCTVKGYAVNDYIHQFFPQIAPRPMIDDLQGLRSVATGDCDAFVADQAIATFLIEQQGLANLKIGGESGYLNRLGVAVSMGDIVLHEILDKTVDRISPDRQREIYGQWVSAGTVLSSSMRAGLVLGAITVIGIVAILWLWSISLRTTVRKQTAQIRHDLNRIQATEAALREKSEELETFFSSALDLLAIADTDGYFHRLNREWEKTLGYPLDELEGRRFLDFVHPEDMEATLAAIGNLNARQAVLNFTNRYRHRDGAYRWIEWRALSAGQRIYAAARDVTEHKRAEAALRESEDTFRKLFEGSPDPILLLQGGRFVECNQAALRLLGTTDKDRFIGSTPLDISPERQPDGRLSTVAAPEYIARAHREGNCRFEWLCQRYDGTPFLLDVSLMPIALRGESLLYTTWRDITARKRSEEALRASETRFRDLSTMSSDWFWEQDDQFRFTYFSTDAAMFALEQMGVGCSTLQGKTRWELLIDLTTAQWAAHRALLEAHQPFRDFEYRMRAKSGADRWFNINGQPLFDDSGRFIGYRGTGREITDRKRVEEALQLAQLSIMRSADAVFWITPEGRFINVNEQACDSLGYTRDELLAMSVWDIDPDFSQEKWLPHWERTRQLKKRRFETRHRRKDGTIFLVEVTANGVEYEGQEYDFAFVRDITDRKQAEEALRASEHKFRAVAQNAQAITFILDHQGVFLLSEGQGLARLGLAPGQVVGLSAFELYKEYPSVIDSIRKALSGELAHVTNVLGNVMLDTVYSPYRDPDAQLSGVIGIAVDITERKRVETALRESEARLRAAIESAPFDFFLIGADGRYVLQNSASKKHWGDVVGKRPAEVTDDPEMLAHWNGNNRRAFAGEIVEEEVRFTAGDEERCIYNTIAPIKDRDTIIGIVGLNIDITERKRAEEELQRHREHLEERVAERTAELRQAMHQLVQSEKLAALGSLVAGVAHELNTPLGNARVVAGSLGEHLREFAAAAESGALRRSQLDAFLARGREAVDLLERNAARAADLIGQFKQVAVDQTSARRRRFDLRQTVEETLATLQPQLKHTAHRIELDIPPAIELDSYPGPLEQVLANLVSNSLAHGFAGIEAGTIRVRAAPLGSDRVQIDYADDGVGIPEATLNRIFEPFFTTKLGSGGSGLGLYIVYNVVTGILGGTVRVCGKLGHGAVFTFVLPRTAPIR